MRPNICWSTARGLDLCDNFPRWQLSKNVKIDLLGLCVALKMRSREKCKYVKNVATEPIQCKQKEAVNFLNCSISTAVEFQRHHDPDLITEVNFNFT
jgi:hypothetical protein